MIKIQLTSTFKKEFKKLEKKSHTLLDSIKNLKSTLLKNPEQGIYLGNDFFKIRIKSDYSGKSGGYRIITYYKKEDLIIFASIYQKSEKSSISVKELQKIIED